MDVGSYAVKTDKQRDGERETVGSYTRDRLWMCVCECVCICMKIIIAVRSLLTFWSNILPYRSKIQYET